MKKRMFALLTVLALMIAALVPAAVAEEVAVSTDPFEEITAEFEQAKAADIEEIVTKPARVTGWVDLHWAPSKSAPLMATYPAKQELAVLAETPNWYQVLNSDTGAVGFINKAYAVDAKEAGGARPVSAVAPVTGESGKENLGVIDINGAFSLQCAMADGYAIVSVKSTSDQLVAAIASADASKPILQLSIAYDEAYANVDRMNDLDDEAMAALEKTFTDADPLAEITYGDTGLGTRLMIVRQVEGDHDFLDFFSIYKGYFVECVMVAGQDAQDKNLTEEQEKMCIDFLTELDFVPAEAIAQAPEGRWMANLTDYNAEAGTVNAELKRSNPMDAAAAEALKVGDTLTFGQYSEAIETLEKAEDGTILINDDIELVNYGGEYHLLVNGAEHTDAFASLVLEIPDDLTFLDGIDPATGDPLDQPAEKTAEDFKAMLASEDNPGFALDNTWVTFDENGEMRCVEREYVPWQ